MEYLINNWFMIVAFLAVLFVCFIVDKAQYRYYSIHVLMDFPVELV